MDAVNRRLGMLDMMMTGGFVGIGMKQENKKRRKLRMIMYKLKTAFCE